ncbi:hypothetical protein DIPPA_10550 [Diplonema papillatum]|nr:hypothetical protein DIPPA_10550 [Diplonema papillatum]
MSTHRPDPEVFANRLKDVYEGKASAFHFFTPDVVYCDPLMTARSVQSVLFLYWTMWIFARDVTYETKSAFQNGSVVLVEAEVQYAWRWPLCFFVKRSPHHLFHTLHVEHRSEGWRCSKLELVKDNYTLSLPAKLVTMLPMLVLQYVFCAGSLTTGLLHKVMQLILFRKNLAARLRNPFATLLHHKQE